MRHSTPVTSGWLRTIGSILIVVLPLVLVSKLDSRIHVYASVLGYAALFLVVGAAAQVGLIVRRWGKINIGRLFFDLGLFIVGGVVVWGVVNLAMRRGGGPVDPSLIAVIMAYILAIWSGQHPS